MKEITVIIKLVIFRITNESLCVYTTNGMLPSKRISESVPLEKQVNNLFSTKLHEPLQNFYFEQLYTFTNENNEISIVYYVLLANSDKLSAIRTGWVSLKRTINKDQEIISYALQRLQWKIEYTNVIYSLLPKIFTLSELQKTYEIILGKNLDKRNFRKKILSLNFLKPTGKKRIDNARPAQTYTFAKRAPQLVKVFS